MKMTDAAIRRAVLDFEEAVLTAEKAAQFLKNLPTPEEEEILKNFQGTVLIAPTDVLYHNVTYVSMIKTIFIQGEPSSLGRVEQFFNQIVSIPRFVVASHSPISI